MQLVVDGILTGGQLYIGCATGHLVHLVTDGILTYCQPHCIGSAPGHFVQLVSGF